MSTTWTVQEGEEGRLDRFISSKSEQSRSAIQKNILEGLATVNGTVIDVTKRNVQPGDIVAYNEPVAPTGFPEGEDIPLDILYEDKYLVAINKPIEMVVHPNDHNESGTLVHALIHHYPDIIKAVYDPESEVSRLRPGIAHRLDKDTTGVIVVAKDQNTLQKLAAMFQTHEIRKEYLALVYGTIKEEETVQNFLVRKQFKRNMMGVSKDEEKGRESITHFKPIESYLYHGQPTTLMSCIIETGRTHQIRVHSKFKGHPVIGDVTYTNKPAEALSKRLGATRQLLHAWRLTFNHPITGKELTITAPLPEDFKAILTKVGAADSLDSRGSYQLFS